MGVLNWNGGKVRIANWVVSMLPVHNIYVEPFFGGGAVFFKKPPSKIEIINDLNSDVTNVFRVVRDPSLCDELIEQLNFTPFSRDEYADCLNIVGSDVERARRFFVAVNCSYRGIYRTGGNFYWSTHASASTFRRRVEMFSDVAERLKYTQIENIDALELMVRRDGIDVCFYCDPPYVNSSRLNVSAKDYDHETDDEWHSRFVDVCLDMEGKVVISGYPNSIYGRLEDCGWLRVDRAVSRSFKDNHDCHVIECLWFSPSCDVSSRHLID